MLIVRFFERSVLPFMDSVSNRSLLTAIRTGLVLTLPLIILGSAAVLVNNFPLPAYREFMTSTFGPGWKDLASAVWNGTIGIMALIINCSIGFQLTERHNERNLTVQINPVIGSLVALASLVVLIRMDGTSGASIPQRWVGVSGLFLSILVAVVSIRIFLTASSIRALRLNISGGSTDSSIPQAFNAMLPVAVTVLFFAGLSILVFKFFNVSVHEGFHDLLRMPFEWVGDGLARGMVYNFVLHILWFFGIHGANVLDPVTHSIYSTAMAANVAAYSAGEAMPHIMTKAFLDVYVFMGGAGLTICLALALIIVGRDRGQKRLAIFSLVPGIFNINEILLFGLPVVLNPIMLIPFVLAPMVVVVVSYMAVASGLVPGPHVSLEWTSPMLLNGYLSTGSIRSVILQLVNLGIGTIIYVPFVRFADTMRARRTDKAFKILLERAVNINSVTVNRSLGRHDAAGSLARNLVTDLDLAINNMSGIFLEYQPQVTAKGGRVFGVEALMRWNHPIYGMIPTPITINLAEEGGLIRSLGLMALDEACATRRKWLDRGIKNLIMSVNLSTLQLEPEIVQNISDVMHHYELPPYMLELEVTESSALDPDSPESSVLQDIHKLGVRLAIDDFGMGHSSLKYLKEFPVDVIKIDGAITKEVTFNPICADIVASITKLCRARDIMSVAEYVETEEQVIELTKHGCDVYQGWYFSKSLPEEECYEFIRTRMTL